MFGSMCAHGFLIWKYSTHNLKKIILTIHLLLRQPVAGSSVVCFSKDIKVPVEVRRILSSVGTSSSNTASRCPFTQISPLTFVAVVVARAVAVVVAVVVVVAVARAMAMAVAMAVAVRWQWHCWWRWQWQ